MLESAVFLKESVIVLLCLLNCQSPTKRTWNFWMIYEEIYIYIFLYLLLSVVMLVYSDDTEMLIVVHSFLFPFFPSMGTWHWVWKSSDVSLFFFFCIKTEEKNLSEIQLVHVVIQSAECGPSWIQSLCPLFLECFLQVPEVPKLFLI